MDEPLEHVHQSIEDEMDSFEIKSNPSAPLGMSCLPVVPDDSFIPFDHVSYTRQAIVDYL